jgi:C4-dicarboxylate-specific signal transduction histidine kinase
MRLLPILLAAAAALTSTWTLAQPAGPATCEAKREAIGRDIEAAKAKGQKQRVRGLEKALSEVRRTCSDAKLGAEHQRRIRSQERKVAERERDLREAQHKGRADKIADREEKLREAQAELQQLKGAQ